MSILYPEQLSEALLLSSDTDDRVEALAAGSDVGLADGAFEWIGSCLERPHLHCPKDEAAMSML
jgi:hypothetical protein